MLDPFCGRGTVPFQAILMERQSIAADINPVAICITKAKTNAPKQSSVRRRLTILQNDYSVIEWEAERRSLPRFFRFAYNKHTLSQLLYLRSVLNWQESNVDCMIAALLLGALHGESNKSPSYLSNQMPRTISTKPAYSVRYWKKHGSKAPRRDTFVLLRDRLAFRYKSNAPNERAVVIKKDIRDLPYSNKELPAPITCVITSPPYLDVTSFEEDQWLRLWFLGGPPHPTYGLVSRDDRYSNPGKYWTFISEMWRSLGAILDDRAHVVIRIGMRDNDPDQVIKELTSSSAAAGRSIKLREHEVSEIVGKQTIAFRPVSKGCRREVDCHFEVA